MFLPASIERSVWEYFSDKAERKGIGLSELLTDVLKSDIEINEALRKLSLFIFIAQCFILRQKLEDFNKQ